MVKQNNEMIGHCLAIKYAQLGLHGSIEKNVRLQSVY